MVQLIVVGCMVLCAFLVERSSFRVNCFSGRGRPQVHLQEQVLMLLHFVAHRGKYGLLADKFGFTRSCYFACVEEMISIITEDLLQRNIFWPNSERQKEMSDYYEQRFGFPGVIGAVDGTHITISKPPGLQFSEDYFSVRKKMYTMLLQVGQCVCVKNSGPPQSPQAVHTIMRICFTLQLTVMDDLTISSINVGHPGRAHDAHVFRLSHLWVPNGGRVEHLVCSPQYHLLGDGAYPTKSYLIKPFRDDGSLTRRQRNFNRVHSSIRSVVERGIGRLKGRFRCLQFLDVKMPEKAKRIIATCCVLHNFAIRNKDVTEDEAQDDNDGRDVLDDVDAEFGLDEEGIDKRQAIMLALPL